jgi:hypothetical protein
MKYDWGKGADKQQRTIPSTMLIAWRRVGRMTKIKHSLSIVVCEL